MRITEAAQRLGTSPRMLRYRDMLGLLPPVRGAAQARGRAGASRDRAVAPRDVTGAPRNVARAPRDRAGTRRDRAPGGPLRAHRRFADEDLAAVAHALRIEQRYDISPAALAFGLRVLTEPGVRAAVAELGRRIGRIAPPPARALEFEQERALRLLRLPAGRAPSGRTVAPPAGGTPGTRPG
jgi:MerR family copper efflux transcriptional regulator